MGRKLPKKVYLKWEVPDGREDPYLLVITDINYIAEYGETVEAGLYELVENVKVVNKSEVVRDGKREVKHGRK